MGDVEEVGALERILAEGRVRAVYQPIIEFRSGRPIAYEALARGPEGSPLERPDRLFATAHDVGLVRELDWACRTTAIEGGLRGRLRPPFSLFINLEPDTIGSRMSAEFVDSWARARLARLPLLFEITERAVLSQPAELLKTVGLLRDFGWGVALDDVGANPESLALFPFIEPDVIKLDMTLIQNPTPDVGDVLLAVNAEAERTGAVILAEGIETEEHLEMAKMYGATIGQGWFFGRPNELPDPLPECGRRVLIREREHIALDRTPHPVVAEKVEPRRVPREYLVQASRLIEKRAMELPHPPLLLATLQHARHFTKETKGIYEELSARLPFVAVVAEGWAHDVAELPRRMPLPPGDPLTNEWTVGVVSPFSAMVMSGLERDDGSEDRSFDVAMSFDRDTAIHALTPVLYRLASMEEGVYEDDEVDFVEAVGAVIEAAAREEDLVRPLLREMSRITGLESTFLSRISDEGHYDVVVSFNHGELHVEEGFRMSWSETICHAALVDNRSAYADVQEELVDNDVGATFGFRTYVTCPVSLEDGTVIGTLCGAKSEVAPLTDAQIDWVRRFAQLVARRVASESSHPA